MHHYTCGKTPLRRILALLMVLTLFAGCVVGPTATQTPGATADANPNQSTPQVMGTATPGLTGEKDRPFEFSGALERLDPWMVAGVTIETDPSTEIETGLQLGDLVKVEGVIRPDGVWVAAEIKRITDPADSKLTLVGPVLSMDPWVIDGLPFIVTAETVINGEISVGMLVRVEAVRLEDGAWQALKIAPVEDFSWSGGCITLRAVVVSVEGDQVQLQGLPLITLTEAIEVTGDLAANQMVEVVICFEPPQTIQIVSITVISVVEPQPDQTEEKVTLCHKPNTPAQKTLTLPRAAVAGHLGHGDTLGACP